MIELGLQRISRLLAKTPLPWRAIHVAGTNGKGSICAYTSAMLDVYNKSQYRQSRSDPALKHARFTSPHLIDRWDCITIDQQTVSLPLFSALEKKVLKRNEIEQIKASEFELLTATAFEIFTQEKVDVGVVEVGMGGRLDATNIIGQPADPAALHDADDAGFRPPPLVTAISKIGMDHQAFLGNTLGEIAREKAGIIKPKVPVVWDASNGTEVVEMLEAQASGNLIVRLDDPTMPSEMLDSNVASVFFPDELTRHVDDNFSVDAAPEHVRNNLSVAFRSTWAALQVLDRLPTIYDTLVDSEKMEIGILASEMVLSAASLATIRGRLQYLEIDMLTSRKESILLDGAHNAQSAEVLAVEVNDLRRQSGQSVTWVIAASDTKDVKEILHLLLQPGDSVFAVEFGPVDGMPWVKPMAAEKLVQAVREIEPESGSIEVQACGSKVKSALRSASKEAAGGPLVVAGSLYLVGDLLRLVRDQSPRSM